MPKIDFLVALAHLEVPNVGRCASRSIKPLLTCAAIWLTIFLAHSLRPVDKLTRYRYAPAVPVLTPQTAQMPSPFMHGAFDRNARRVVTTEGLPTATIWDVETGDILRSIVGTAAAFYSVAFSPDGHFLLTTNTNINAQVWSADTGKLVEELVDSKGALCGEFSPDGLCIALGTDKNVRLFDSKSGTLIAAFANPGADKWLKKHEHDADYVEAIHFSPDGNQVVAAFDDGASRIWDINAVQVIQTFVGHAGKVLCASFSPDGRQIVTGSADRTITVWNVQSGKQQWQLSGFKWSIRAASFSPNGKWILAGAEPGTVLSPNGKLVLTQVEPGTALILNAASGTKARALSFDKTGDITDAPFSSSVRRVIAGTWGSPTIWNVSSFDESGIAPVIPTATGAREIVRRSPVPQYITERMRDLSGLTHELCSAMPAPDGKHIVTVYRDYVEYWGFNDRLQKRILDDSAHWWLHAAISPDGLLAALTNQTGEIAVQSSVSGKIVAQLVAPTSRSRPATSLWAVVFSPDGSRVAATDLDYNIHIWNIATGRIIRTIQNAVPPPDEGGAINSLDSLEFSPDGKRLLTAGISAPVREWDIRTGGVVRTIKPPAGSLSTFACYSPDGKRIFAGADSQIGEAFAHIYDEATGRPVSSQKRTTVSLDNNIYGNEQGRFRDQYDEDPISGSFSPDGKWIATAANDQVATIWNVATGRAVRQLFCHNGFLKSATFTADGKFIVTANWNGTTELWNAANGRELCSLFSFKDGTWAVTNPEGRYDASNGGDVAGLHWVVGNEPIALSQLRDRYYEPGLLAKIMGFDKTPLRDVQAFDHVKLYPEVTTTSDPSGAPNRVAVHLTVRGGGIGRVQIYVNDVLFQDDARPAGADSSGKTLDFTVDVSAAPTLRPGGLAANDIRVVAYNGENWLPSRPIALSRGVDFLGPPPAAGSPVSGVPAKRRLFAIVAGTSDYAGPALHLKFSAQDAVSFAKALNLGTGGDPLIEQPDIILLAAGPGTPAGTLPPTKANLAAAFAHVVAQKPSPDDILVVYLAGHGVAIPLADSTYCYLAQNANSADTTTLASDSALRSATTVTSSELAEWMGKIGATYRVVILDTCAAGAAGKAFMDKRAVSGDQIRAMKRFQATEGCHVLMGCAADKVSYEASQYGQGLLTYALLQGMKGPALRENSWIDVRTLFGYVEETVPKLAGDIGGIQQPAYQKPDAGSFDIGKLTEADRAGIRLTAARPQVVHPRMSNRADIIDDLDLETLVRARLSDTDAYAGARGSSSAATGGGAGFVYVDADQLTGAIQIVGQYVETGDSVTVTVALVRDHKRVDSVIVTGKRDAPDKLAGDIVAAVTSRLGSLDVGAKP